MRSKWSATRKSTPQFQSAAESAHGSSLDWFFQEWVYDLGWPEYQYAWNDRPVGGVHHLDLFIGQTQTNGPTFTMPVDVKVTTAAGDSLMVVWVDARQKWFDLTVNGAPTAVALDPDNWILCRKQQIPYTAVPRDGSVPAETVHLRIVPNPSGGLTALRWEVSGTAPARAEIFNLAGELVRTLCPPAGSQGRVEILWNGKDERGAPLASGTYVCRVSSGSFCSSRHLTLLR